MNSISEAEVQKLGKRGALDSITVVRSAAGAYSVMVKPFFEVESQAVTTSRKSVREWKSLDRLMRHIHEHYGQPIFNQLVLTYPEKK